MMGPSIVDASQQELCPTPCIETPGPSPALARHVGQRAGAVTTTTPSRPSQN
jgi:hypothetical protein